MKCGYCKKEGHNKRTCKKTILELHNKIVDMLININNKIIDLNKRS